MDEKKIGVVGLGAMGLGMAKSLRRAGYSVHVVDVRHDVAQAYAAEGGVVCNSPAELAATCDVLISVVVNAAQTEGVLFGENGAVAAMRPGSVFVMCSTVDPAWSVSLEKRLAEKNILYLDAPISGGAAKAAKGEITGSGSGERQQGQDHQSASGWGAHRRGGGSDGAGPASGGGPCGAL
jgi:putative dehydrogenase